MAIGESAKSNILKEENNTGFEEKAGDIYLDNDPAKTDLVEFDIN